MLHSQVVISPFPHQEGYFTFDDIWKVNLINSQNQIANVQIEVTMEDAQRQQVFLSISPVFNLPQGVSRPSFNISSAKLQYGISNATNVLRSTGRLPYGNYIVCYRVNDANSNVLLGELCQEETVKPFSPPELVSPFNGEDIVETNPLLTWKPPFPPGTTPVEYTLKLVEIIGKQDAITALESNPPLIYQNKITGTVLPYPGSARPGVSK